MPKPITVEMLEAMSLDQRKTLHRNALGLDTPAARDVIELLSHGDLLGAPKSTARKAPAKPAAARKTRAAAKPKAKAAPKPVQAVYGRQA